MAKTFVGGGWKSKYGIKLSIKKEKIESLPTNKYGDVLLEIQERKEPDPKSKQTHYVVVDDYAYGKLNEATPTAQDPDWLPF